jgi:predicted small lipoprotein YifL
MKTGTPRRLRRFMTVAAAGILVVLLAACTGRGGGYLPPDDVFTGQASFGFSFSCEDKGGLNPPTGQLRIELAYTDHGSNPIGSSFGIHGTVDTIDPVLESMICIGQEPPPGGNELIFLGRYRLTSEAPAGFPTTCPTKETPTSPLCRFEVIVQDNDGNLAPSMGDHFSIKLSTVTSLVSVLPVGTVFYARAGYLAGGNLTVN